MSEKRLFKGATVIDGTGKAPVKTDLLIEGRDILEVGSVICEDAKIIDVSGKTIMPGLINAHVHITFDSRVADTFGAMDKQTNAGLALMGQYNLLEQLRGGVTYFRDMGAPNYVDVDLRNARNNGIVQGPEFQCAGKVITMTGGHAWKMGRECDGCNEVRKATREQLRAGADLVKIIATGGVITQGVEPGAPQLNYDEICVAVEEAHKAGKKTATHAQGSTGILNAVRAGIDSVEHGIYLTDEIIELMLKKGTYLVPTLMAPYAIGKEGVAAGIPPSIVAKSNSVIDDHLASLKRAYEAGVKIAMGADSGTPFNHHGESYYELKLMIDNGMTPMDAIICATKNAADLMGIVDRYGTLEKGKAADFLILGNDPLADITALSHSLLQVYKLGELVR